MTPNIRTPYGLSSGGLTSTPADVTRGVVRVDVVHPDQDELLGAVTLLVPVPGVAAGEPELVVADDHLGFADVSVTVDVSGDLFEPEHARQPVETGGGVLVMQVWRDTPELHRAHRGLLLDVFGEPGQQHRLALLHVGHTGGRDRRRQRVPAPVFEHDAGPAVDRLEADLHLGDMATVVEEVVEQEPLPGLPRLTRPKS